MSVFVFHVVGMLARTMDREGRLLTIRFEADVAGVGCLVLGAVLSLRADIPDVLNEIVDEIKAAAATIVPETRL